MSGRHLSQQGEAGQAHMQVLLTGVDTFVVAAAGLPVHLDCAAVLGISAVCRV